MPTGRQWQRKQIVGYVIIGIVVVGLIYLVYWLMTEKPSRRFRGIEKIRGDVPVQMLDVVFDERQPALFQPAGLRELKACRDLDLFPPPHPRVPG